MRIGSWLAYAAAPAEDSGENGMIARMAHQWIHCIECVP
jgi:hypothetical protein